MTLRNRKRIEDKLAAYYSLKMNGKVWCLWDEERRAYCIRGEGLPPHPDLKEQYPNGWSLVDYIKPNKALRLIGESKRYIDTTWEVRDYDVWGNAREGYEVNNTFSRGQAELHIPVEVCNPDTPQQFESAFPTSTQIRKALGLRRFAIELDGDDLTIYVNRARDGYPCGELHCVSHSSLSPIKAVSTPEYDGIVDAQYHDEQ